MINELEIRNFQSHKETDLIFVPGVNVILGQSDVGKSSVIRAIRWAISNRPSGNSFRANFASDTTEVSMGFGEEFISRQKGKKVNRYETESGELKALRSEVPQEVQDITRMEEVNIQPQYESYFLLDETPGNVAKAFNSVSGLEEMDAALKNINSKVRTTSSEMAVILKNIVSFEEQINDLDWLKKSEIDLNEMEKQEAKLKEQKGKISELRQVLVSLSSKKEKLKQLPDFSALPKIQEIFELDAVIDAKLKKTNKLIDCLDSLTAKQKKKDQYDALDDLSLSSTDEISQQIKAKTNAIVVLNKVIIKIHARNDFLADINLDLEVLKNEYLEIEQSLEICPTCNQYILEKS